MTFKQIEMKQIKKMYNLMVKVNNDNQELRKNINFINEILIGHRDRLDNLEDKKRVDK